MKLGLKGKLIFLISIPIASIIMLAVFSLSNAKELGRALATVVNQDVPSALSLGALNSTLMTMTVNFYEAASSKNQMRRQAFLEDAKEEFESLKKEIENFSSFSMNADEKVAFSKFLELWKVQQSLIDEVNQNLTKGETEAALAVLTSKYQTKNDEIDALFVTLDAIQTKNGEETIAASEALESRTFRILGIVAAASIFATILFGTLLITSLLRTFNRIISQLNENSDQVASASSHIATASQELSQATTEQAASLEETAASLEQITSMIAKATDNAQFSATTSAESQKTAEEGREAVEQMLTSIDEISQSNDSILMQINESNREMTDIVKVIQDIGNRTKVINEIVFQTKLLSFNASVEAARAGEHGKGFAVVAEEVGNLAQMSGNAAKEISDMLDSSISKVEGIVRNTQEKVETLIQNGKEKVDSGAAVAKRCSEVLNEIVQNVSKVTSLSQEISQASQEQAQGVSEINKAMSQLDTVTQQNAATSEEAASSAEELSAQADSLKSSVEELVRLVTGSTSNQTSHNRVPPVVAKESVNPKKSSNLISMKPRSMKRALSTDSSFLRKASGDETNVPSREDEGFKDE